mmetsp:Transcript_128402/g.399621  ORF Transcript_128402/g.399621 Transcript_128402/m.399621 type:complete len:242 (+) Transcript_128402:1244-1969(+)
MSAIATSTEASPFLSRLLLKVFSASTATLNASSTEPSITFAPTTVSKAARYPSIPFFPSSVKSSQALSAMRRASAASCSSSRIWPCVARAFASPFLSPSDRKMATASRIGARPWSGSLLRRCTWASLQSMAASSFWSPDLLKRSRASCTAFTASSGSCFLRHAATMASTALTCSSLSPLSWPLESASFAVCRPSSGESSPACISETRHMLAPSLAASLSPAKRATASLAACRPFVNSCCMA